MEHAKKIIIYISWVIIAIMGILLFVNWNTIADSVPIHSGLGHISYGSKYTLIFLFVIAILVNGLFTFGYTIAFIKDMKKLKLPPVIFDCIVIIVQVMIILVECTFILLPIIK